jgi:hypothetical protein
MVTLVIIAAAILLVIALQDREQQKSGQGHTNVRP